MSNGHPQVLPKFHGARGGSGCDNPDCGASERHLRVLSEEELERMYPSKDKLPQWPLPPQATHACEKCGYCYQGVAGQLQLQSTGDGSELVETVDVAAFDWEPDSVYDRTVRESIESVVAGRPDDADFEDVAEVVYRYVPGAGTDDARTVVNEMSVEMSTMTRDISEFM